MGTQFFSAKIYHFLAKRVLAIILLFHGIQTDSIALKNHETIRLEQLNSVPEGWRVFGVPNPSQRILLRIALHQQNVKKFEQLLLDISTPGNPQYGHHLSRSAVKAILRPKEEAIDGVINWLKTEGIHDFQHDSDWIHFNVSVKQAEKMLDTEFKVYHNDVSGLNRIRTLGYSEPVALKGFIDMIQPTTRFGQLGALRSTILRKKKTKPANRMSQWIGKAFDLSQCNIFGNPPAPSVTPECIRNLYKLGNVPSSPVNARAKLGVCGYLEEWAKYADLEIFLQQYAPYAVGTNFSVTLLNGGKNEQAINNSIDSTEANLDVQMGVSLAYPIPVTYFSTGGRGEIIFDLAQPDSNGNEPYLDFLTYMMSLPDDQLPQTLATSYGESEQSVPAAYAQSTCNMFAQLGARGVSVIFASGDSGLGAGCQTNDGTQRTRFIPIFPAACPFVTSVGATEGVPERGAQYSGGGFSDRWARPSYQDAAVKPYLVKLANQWQGLYNPNGRAIPDVAAQGSNIQIVDSLSEAIVTGTSVSSPIFASVIALINTNRLQQGQSPLGFLNPWLYTTGKAGLNDITDGQITGCSGGPPGWPVVPGAAFNATQGWDPVAGLGTPDYEKLLALSPKTSYYY